jgi:Tfp pilus assembly protein PilO
MSQGAPFWRRRLLPLFVALLAVNVLALVVWTGPRYWMQKNAARRAQAARAELDRQRQVTIALRERAAAIRENAADAERFQRSLVGAEKQDLLPALKAIEDLARAPGLRPGGRGFEREGVPDAPVERVGVTLPLEGSYEQLVGFLREVEASPRFLTVDRVSMRAQHEGGARLQVELSTYLRQSGEAPRGEERRGR